MRVPSSLRRIAQQALGPRGTEFVSRSLHKARGVIQAVKNEPAVRIVIARSKRSGTTPKDWFSTLDDETWLWMNTVARRRRKAIAKLVPQMPEPRLQEGFTGQSGDATLKEGFGAYQIFKNSYERHVGPIGSCRAIMDFGCGWGRIIRFFLKDIESENLVGIDHSEEAIHACREGNTWCKFAMIEPFPPTPFPGQSFDLIYLYSVFSHLPEKMHWAWLEEFRRLLRPGGMLIATTFPRDFIHHCKAMRDDPQFDAKPRWAMETAKAFMDTEVALSEYDKGHFCYSSRGAEGRWSFWGEACIPRLYVEKRWREIFDICEYIEDTQICPQNVIVVRKRM
jgi:SAM-dependent methyltransferase